MTSGATMVDSEGRVGGSAISGEVSDWVDCSGTVAASRQAGAALFPYASAQGFPLVCGGLGDDDGESDGK